MTLTPPVAGDESARSQSQRLLDTKVAARAHGVRALMLLKLLEAGRANALKGMPMKKEGTPYL